MQNERNRSAGEEVRPNTLCFHEYCAGSRSDVGRTQPMTSVLVPCATCVLQSSELGIEEIENKWLYGKS